MVGPATAPPLIELNSGNVVLIPEAGTPFGSPDGLEPMVSGIPLIMGAKKGYPALNEFAMQT